VPVSPTVVGFWLHYTVEIGLYQAQREWSAAETAAGGYFRLRGLDSVAVDAPIAE
jgi:hypothetical protein